MTSLPSTPKTSDFCISDSGASTHAEQFETALQDINRLIEVEDYPDSSIYVRASVYKALGQNDLALADLNMLINKEDTRMEFLRQSTQEIEELVKAGKRCLTKDMVSRDLDLMVLYRFALKQKMIIHAEASDWTSTLATLDLMIKDDPDDVDHLRKRGIVLEELGRPSDALAAYDQAIRLIETEEGDRSNSENGYADTYDYRASLHQSHHRADQTRLDFDRALKLDDSAFVEAFQLRMQEAGHYEGPLNGTNGGATKDAMHLCASDIRCVDPDV